MGTDGLHWILHRRSARKDPRGALAEIRLMPRLVPPVDQGCSRSMHPRKEARSVRCCRVSGPVAGIAKSMRLTESRHGQRPIGHLLNVRADNMSAFSDRPDHFLDWIRDLPEEERGPVNTTADRLTFVPRSLAASRILSLSRRGGRRTPYEIDAAALAVGKFSARRDAAGLCRQSLGPGRRLAKANYGGGLSSSTCWNCRRN